MAQISGVPPHQVRAVIIKVDPLAHGVTSGARSRKRNIGGWSRTSPEVPMSPRPMLILDLDGVISPYGSEAKDGMAAARVGGYRLLYRPDVIAGLNALNKEGDVELRWLTSWGSDVRTHVAPALGLDDFPLLGEETSMSRRRSWPKPRSVLMKVPAGTKFVWVDDDLTPARQGRIRRALGSEQCLLLRPERNLGLTTHGLDRARMFLSPSGRVPGEQAL